MLTLHDNSVSGEFPDEVFSVFVNGRKLEFSARRTMKDAEVPYAFGSFDSDEKVFVEIRSGGNLAGGFRRRMLRSGSWIALRRKHRNPHSRTGSNHTHETGIKK